MKVKNMKLPIGLSDFRELIKDRYRTVDKTLLIKDVIESDSKVILITRPRRFGKTLNLSMLYYFLQCHDFKDENIFKNLNIAKHQDFCKEHQGQHPVIFITLKDMKQANYAEAYADIVELIGQLYSNHYYLLDGDLLREKEKLVFNSLINKEADIADIKVALKNLCGYLMRKFGKPAIILMDEYDTPIQEAYLRGYYQEMVDLMRSTPQPGGAVYQVLHRERLV
jgi:hypothetical protein